MKKTASLMVLAAATLWGSSGLFIDRIARTGLSGAQMTAVRLCMVPIFVAALLYFTDRRQLHVDGKDMPFQILNGIVGIFVFNLCYTYAIRLVGMATAAVLIYLMPSLVMLYSVLFLGERFTARKGLCLVLSLVGCGLVSGLADGFTMNAMGLIMGLISALCYALYNILVVTRLKKYSSFTNVLYPFAFAAVAAVAYVAVCGEFPGTVETILRRPDALAWCAALAVCCSVASYWLYNTAVKTVGAGHAAIIATFEPVAAALLGLVILHERLTVWSVLGIGCELTALILLNLPEKN